MAYEDRSDDELDSLVHDLKSDEAARLNNAGRAAQLAYLNGNDHDPPAPSPPPSTPEVMVTPYR